MARKPIITTQNKTVRISSEDQSIWDSGPAPILEWSEYFPIIGGDRTSVEVSNVNVSTPIGEVSVDGERIEYDDQGAFAALPNGLTREIVITYDVTDAAGVTESKRTVIEARGGIEGTTFVNPETGETNTGKVGFSAVDAADILQDVHRFETVTPVNVSFNAQEAFGDKFDGVLGGFQSAADATADNLNRAERSLARVEVQADDAENRADKINKVVGLRTELEIKEAAAKAAAELVTLAERAERALDDAIEGEDLARGARDAAIRAERIANGAVDLAEDAVKGAKAVAETALAGLNSASKGLADAQDAVTNFVGGLFGGLLRLAGLEDEANAAQRAFNSAQINFDSKNNALTRAQRDLERKEINLENAKDAVTDARKALTDASDAAAEALEEFTDLVGRESVEGLRKLQVLADSEVRKTQGELDDAVADMRADSIFTDRLPNLGDGLAATAEAAALNGVELGAKADVLTAEIANDAAGGAFRGARDLLNSTNVEADVEVTVDAFAQAGLQVDFKLDGGSVDTDLDFDLTSTSSLDVEADTFSIAPVAVNTVTGEATAFETVSPNMKFYAGIAYHAGATIDVFVDLFAELGGLTVLDFPEGNDPFTFTETVVADGFIDLVDFDSTEFEGFDFDFPGFVGDIVSAEFNLPSIKTQGKESDFDTAVYRDLPSVDLDQLADTLLNLVDLKFDFSPELKAAMEAEGRETDIFSDSFAQALVDALGVVVQNLGGGADTDGDGVVPIFLAQSEDSAALFHLDTIADDLSGLDVAGKGQFGFFVASGESKDVFQVSVDVDQLIATAVNVAFGNAPDKTINPLDMSVTLADAFDSSPASQRVLEEINKFIQVELSAELADLDVRAGAKFNQDFALSVDDIVYDVVFEDGTTRKFAASETEEIVIENASELADTNGDGDIDYTLNLTPVAEFFNDTEIDLNVGYTLDFIKAQLNLAAQLPLSELGIGLPDIPGLETSLSLGPVLRLEGDLDVVSADVFENRFDFDAGTGSIDGSFDLAAFDDDILPGGPVLIDPVVPIDPGVLVPKGPVAPVEPDAPFVEAFAGAKIVGGRGSDVLTGGIGDDLIKGKRGRDDLIGAEGADTLQGGKGRDQLFGDQGDDVLNGGKGRDVLTGGQGADRFVFKKGSDIVTDFEQGEDQIVINRLRSVDDFSDLARRMEQDGDDVVIDFGRKSLTLLDTEASALGADDFVIV